LQTRRNEIINQVAAVNQRAKAVEKMGIAIQSQIEDIYKRAMHDLSNTIREKVL
jgi:hypothetical protein